MEFAFPRDHGAHPEFRSEWWYLTAVLKTDDGRLFGTQFTLFRQGLTPREPAAESPEGAAAWRTGQIYMAHTAVSDVATQNHLHAERIVRGHPALAGVTASPFSAYLEGWQLASLSTDFWPLELTVETADFDVALSLTGTKPVVRQGERGLSHKGPDNASYYYSIPRIRAEGTVRVGGDQHAVKGLAWLDREWSTSVLAPEYAGWDWFALHLDDGRDLMAFRLRRVDGAPDPYGAGKLVTADGQSTTLSATDFTLAVKDTWRGWPLHWELRLHDERFDIEATFEDQIMDTSVRYWEGVVMVSAEGEPAGTGYMELTGY